MLFDYGTGKGLESCGKRNYSRHFRPKISRVIVSRVNTDCTDREFAFLQTSTVLSQLLLQK